MHAEGLRRNQVPHLSAARSQAGDRRGGSDAALCSLPSRLDGHWRQGDPCTAVIPAVLVAPCPVRLCGSPQPRRAPGWGSTTGPCIEAHRVAPGTPKGSVYTQVCQVTATKALVRALNTRGFVKDLYWSAKIVHMGILGAHAGATLRGPVETLRRGARRCLAIVHVASDDDGRAARVAALKATTDAYTLGPLHMSDARLAAIQCADRPATPA